MPAARLGVVGFGRRLRSMLGTLRKLEPDATVAAVLDPRAEALKAEFPSDLGGATVYQDVAGLTRHPGLDGVMVGTRCTLHTPYAVEVLASGLPLFLEKPVATSWQQLEELARAAERTTSPVVVSFPLRVSSMCELAKELAPAPIGQVQATNNIAAYGAGYYHGWMRDEEQTGGLWLQKATHDFDYLNYLIGERPTRIMAMETKNVFTGDMPVGLRCVECRRDDCPERASATESWLCAFAPDTGNHDSASAIVQYASGLHLVYTQNFYTRRGAAARGARLIGYRRTVEFDWYRDEVVVHHHHEPRVERHEFQALPGEGHHGGDAALASDFLKVMRGTGASRAPLSAGLLSVQMCLAARDACRSGQAAELARTLVEVGR
jgi:predicted dehydrogenase